MIFARQLERLRQAAAVGMPGCPAGKVTVDARDLRELLHHFDRIDAELRTIHQATASASQTANSEAQADLYRNSEAQDCHCNACHKEKLAANPPADRMASLMALTSRGMVLCPICGNKRCPHANDHRHACTGSNEPGQVGSAYAVENIPADFLLVQRNPDKAVCLDGSRFHGWLMYRHPDGQFVTERKLEPWELMQAEDQRHYGIVLDGAAAQKGGA